MSGKRILTPLHWFTLGLLGLGAIGVGVIAHLNNDGEEAPVSPATAGIYGQDVPPSTLAAELQPGLVLLTPHQLALVPVADGFQSPCGTATGGFVYDAQPFNTPNEKRGGHHTGSDINGIGGENTDLGLPVNAAARGLVVYSGEPSPEWGKVVVLAHRLPGDGRIIQTLYAHLDKSIVNVGRFVGRGEPIGTVGTANGHYLAHLHFEAIASSCTEAGQRAYSTSGTMNRLNPQELLASHPAPAVPDPYGTVRRLRVREAAMQQPISPAAKLPAGTIPVNPSQFL
ncbi:MAG: M23 family metallopeptidase [Akkermansiaceae bacterium]|nr:M23 family metallopeptidase [Akkermansiaceae bacterium]